MVKCGICHSTVTKRQTLLVDPFGRICRSHPEVEQHLDKLSAIKKEQDENQKLQKALQNFQVIVIVEQIRVMAYLKGMSLPFACLIVCYRLPKNIREQVENEVKRKGPLSDDEMKQAITMAALMATKK